jgi:hypothetical protein
MKSRRLIGLMPRKWKANPTTWLREWLCFASQQFWASMTAPGHERPTKHQSATAASPQILLQKSKIWGCQKSAREAA